jgi:hypothetical protein
MSLTISGASAGAVSSAVQSASATQPANNASGSTAQSSNSASSTAQQQAALNRLLAKYKADLSRGQSASALASLGRQITAAAKALGQHVSLPKAPASDTSPASGASTATEAGPATSSNSRGTNLLA